MQKSNWVIYSLSTLLLAGAMFTSSCKKDDNPSSVTVSSAKSDTKELAGATAAEKVSVSANIVLTFSKAINAATASDFTLTPAGGTAATLTVTSSGTTVTLDPTGDLLTGTSYTLAIKNTIKGTDGGAFAAKSITFKTDGLANVTPPQASHQIAYWNFNNNVNSSVGTWTSTNVSSSFAADRGGYANSSVAFNGSTDIIEVDNGGNLFAPSSTWSFWVWADTTSGHGLFCMGINGYKGSQIEIDGKCGWIKNAASFSTSLNSDLVAEDLWFNGEGKTKDNGGWQGWNFNTDIRATGGVKNVLAMKWAHVVYTYDAATKLRTVYINGTKMMQSDFNLWPAGDPKLSVTGQKAGTGTSGELSSKFAAGLWATETWGDYTNAGANHFKGRLDDVRFFNVALTAAEVSTLYNAEK
jgi:Bacterial Ig-like domain